MNDTMSASEFFDAYKKRDRASYYRQVVDNLETGEAKRVPPPPDYPESKTDTIRAGVLRGARARGVRVRTVIKDGSVFALRD